MMWSGPWQQWPLQQSMYQNVPHEQVDWAALAKQWIQLQHVHKTDVRPPDLVSGPPIMPLADPEAVPVVPMPVATTKIPLLSNPIIPHEVPRVDTIPHIEPEVQHGAESFLQPGSKEGGYWHGGWEGDALSNESWPAQPPAEESFGFGHMHGNQHLQAQSYDYNHGSDHYGYNQDFSSDMQYSQYWTDQSSAVLHPFVRQEKKLRPNESSLLTSEQDAMHGQLDAAKRKTLPAWIREGLEKMERQRQKKMESEKQYSKKPPDPLLLQEVVSNDTSSRPKSYIDAERSRFESESEGEDESRKDGHRESSPAVENHSPNSPMTEHLTEEEKRQELMLKVRKMLTEILLGVTNEEIASISKEVYQRALSKAPARQLVSSSALASIAGGLGGLADYGSEESDDAGNEDEDSDEELDRKIREKQKAFAIREKEIVAMLDQEEAAERQRLKAKQEPASDDSPKRIQNEPATLEPSPSSNTLNSESIEKPAVDPKSEPGEKQPKSDVTKESVTESQRNASSTSQSPDSDSSDSSTSSSSSSSRKRKKKSSGSRRKSRESRKSRTRRSSSRESDRGSRRKSSRKRSRSRDGGKDSDRDGRSRKDRHRSKSSDRSGRKRPSRSAERRRSSRRRSKSTEYRSKRDRSRDRHRSRSRDKRRSRSRDKENRYKSKVKSKKRSQSKSPARRSKTKRERSPSPKKSKKRRSRSSSSDSEKSNKKSSGKK